MILDRNRIYSIGKNPKTVTLKAIDKQSNKIIDSFEIYKCVRRKNKLFTFCLNAKCELTFNNSKNAIKYSDIIKKGLV